MTTSTDPLAAWLRWFEQQQASTGTKETGGDQSTPEPWSKLLDESLGRFVHTLSNASDWQQCLAAHVNTAMQDAARLATSVTNPLAHEADWLKHFSAFRAPPHGNKDASLATELFGHVCTWPALGLAAADDGDWQAFQEAVPAFQGAGERYSEILFTMMATALTNWQKALESADSPPTDIDFIRQQWLDALESAWQTMLKNPEHTRRLRELNAAIDQLRTSGTRMANGMFRALGIPTREDLLGTQRRLQQVRRKINIMDQSTELAMLREDVAMLREDLAMLRRETAAANHGNKT
ncbi:MAG: poly(R)-hydroxyalkanoic acid synthase subunit PhaE [Aquisalimonadaceae bacterium]